MHLTLPALSSPITWLPVPACPPPAWPASPPAPYLPGCLCLPALHLLGQLPRLQPVAHQGRILGRLTLTSGLVLHACALGGGHRQAGRQAGRGSRVRQRKLLERLARVSMSVWHALVLPMSCVGTDLVLRVGSDSGHQSNIGIPTYDMLFGVSSIRFRSEKALVT